MISTLSYLLLLKLATSHEAIQVVTNNTLEESSFNDVSENVLCRGCGSNITRSSSIITKFSPLSDYSFYDSVFNQDEVLIQVVTTDIFLPYSVITTSHSTCMGITEWEVAGSWYPGYRWKPCVCPECGALVGWLFEPINGNFVDYPEKFFGLIISSLVAESCAYDVLLSYWSVKQLYRYNPKFYDRINYLERSMILFAAS